MPQARIYLDHNAGSPLRPEARAAMLAALEAAGNPSSVHAPGRAARQAVERARTAVAALVGGDPRAVTFTSGGTEANATVLTPEHRRGSATLLLDTLVISAVEHASVLAGGRFPRDAIRVLPVDEAGRVCLPALEALLAEEQAAGRTALVSVMLANNETGVIQLVAEVARRAHAAGGLCHADAAQAAGRMAIDLSVLDVDYLTLSAHKLGGPQGAGAIIARGEGLHPPPLLVGGGQEGGRRAGTQNVAAIAGFGAAAAVADPAQDAARLVELQAFLETGLVAICPEVTIFARSASRLPNTTCFAAPGLAAETLVIGFDLAGVAVSSGSACSSGKVGASHVLTAMGVAADLVRGGIRVSLGWSTSRADVEHFLEAWRALEERMRGHQRHAA